MRPAQKILTAALWGLTVLAMMSVIGAGLWKRQRERETAGVEIYTDPSSRPQNLEVLGTVPPFALVDQDNKPFTQDSLRGHAYLATFIYTHCAGPCPMMTAKMSAMQSLIPDHNIHLVTITVDPEHDTPAVMKEYAKNNHADLSRWHFVTGNQDAVFALARGMLVGAAPAQGDQPILHSEKFVLVDARGQIRGQYHIKDEQGMARLPKDAEKIGKEATGLR